MKRFNADVLKDGSWLVYKEAEETYPIPYCTSLWQSDGDQEHAKTTWRL